MLYSRSLLLFCFIYSSVYMSIPNSNLCLFLLVSQVCFLYVCDYFCFVNKFICTIFLDSTCKPYHMIFVFLSLTYFTWYDNLQVHPSCCKWHYFFFAVEYCSTVYMYHIFLILYPVDGGSDGKESTCNAGAAAAAAKSL